MTFIEFFDKNAVENVSACLVNDVSRVVYIGHNSKQMKKHIANYDKVFKKRGKNIEFLYKSVSKNNLESIVSIVCEIVDKYDDCVFDITGGDELMAMALGIVYEKNRDKNIQIHRYNLRNNAVYDYDKVGNYVYNDELVLSCEENIRVYGGDIVYGGVFGEDTYLWDLTEDFVSDVEKIWNLCKVNSRAYNINIGVLEAIEGVGLQSEDKLTTVALISDVESHLEKYKVSYKEAEKFILRLMRFGLIIKFDDRDKIHIKITYKNEQIKRCLTKAGQIFELKIYMMAKNVRDKFGNPIYSDVLNGVVIDWDGVVHDEEKEKIYDTENEIDVLMMHGIVPVFVSCKNGAATVNELYKLNTVAERFGGKYAKKVLIAASIPVGGEAGEYFRQRAIDMKIQLIEETAKMSDDEIERKLKSLWTL